MRISGTIGLVAAALTLVGCTILWHHESSTTYEFVDLEVRVIDELGQPVPAKTVFVVERIGITPNNSMKVVSDSMGRIRLEGFFCVPFTLLTEGGAGFVGFGESRSTIVIKLGEREGLRPGSPRKIYDLGERRADTPHIC